MATLPRSSKTTQLPSFEALEGYALNGLPKGKRKFIESESEQAMEPNMTFVPFYYRGKSKTNKDKSGEIIDARAGLALAARLANERLTRIYYITEIANVAFGNKKLAQKFLNLPHPKLGMTPLQKLETEWGGREVETILNSIIYGLPA